MRLSVKDRVPISPSAQQFPSHSQDSVSIIESRPWRSGVSEISVGVTRRGPDGGVLRFAVSSTVDETSRAQRPKILAPASPQRPVPPGLSLFHGMHLRSRTTYYRENINQVRIVGSWQR